MTGEPLRVALLGAQGRVGRLVVEAVAGSTDAVVVAQVGRGQVGPGCFRDAQVVIDFSLPEALARALPFVGDAALVSGTTGIGEALHASLIAQAKRAPVLRADNFSVGVNALGRLVEQAAASLPDYDIEIVEVHHRNKVDAPSGTAMFLVACAEAGRGASATELVYGRRGHTGVRPAGPIGVHALRGGDVVGEHTVWMCGPGDRLQLGHVATSRATFAHGALRAARWLSGRTAGWYTMRQVLGEAPFGR